MNCTIRNRCCCGFLPPYIVDRLADTDTADLRRVGIDTLIASASARARREVLPDPLLGRTPMPGFGRRRRVFDMEGREVPLPGTLRRGEKSAGTDDPDVERAFEHAGTTYGFYKDIFGRESLDGAGGWIVSSINFGRRVANAFWNGDQMIYGAGDGTYFKSFTLSLGIAAHEMSHGILDHTSKLAYLGETGALNESFCDVMGASVEQFAAQQTVEEALWMLGGEVTGPALVGVRGFRSFSAEPAYRDHPVLGSDPQPKHFADFVNEAEDNGGVHKNSGIPNHAFYLAARAIGGRVWDKASRIWFEAFTRDLNNQATFVQAATATVTVSRRLFSEDEASAVAGAWRQVGVEPEA